jgi:hypothetical protein
MRCMGMLRIVTLLANAAIAAAAIAGAASA